MKINFRYLKAFIAIFIVELFIAVFIHDRIVRPYIGDILVIVLMHTFIKIFTKKEIRLLPVYLFVFAAFVEGMQFFNIVKILGLENNKVLSIIIGSTFDIKDILCYLVGSVILLIWDNRSSLKEKCNIF